MCVCVCECVCLLSHISPLEHLLVLKILSCTQRAKEVKIFVGFQWQRSSTPPLKAIRTIGHFHAEIAHAYLTTCTRYSSLCGSCRELSCHWSCLQARSVHNGVNSWRGGFCTLVHSYYPSKQKFEMLYIASRGIEPGGGGGGRRG